MNKKLSSLVLFVFISASVATAQNKTLTTPEKKESNTTGQTTNSVTQTQELNKSTKEQQQPVTPPEVVNSKFKSMYPGITAVKWVSGKNGNYAAMFKNGTVETRAVYSPDGNFLRQVRNIQKSELPAPVNSYLDTNFPGKAPKKCEEFKTPKGKYFYSIKYDDKIVRLDAAGNPVANDGDKNNDGEGFSDDDDKKEMPSEK